VFRRVSLSAGGLLIFLFVSACSLTRPVPIALSASELRTFLAEHPQDNLRISEHSGRQIGSTRLKSETTPWSAAGDTTCRSNPWESVSTN
jgi:hypothetical protein